MVLSEQIYIQVKTSSETQGQIVGTIQFVVKVHCKIETRPWALTLTEPVPEAFESPASDWPEKKFLANQRREAAG